MNQLYIPGDKWLYYNLYCGVNTQDELLKTVILPLTSNFLNNGFIIKWFFIRYADPDLHLRLRFEITSYENIGFIMQEMNEKLTPFIKSYKIWKVTLDSYKPENLRYHHSAINIAEEFFFLDSQTTALFISRLEGDKWEDVRWKYALLSIDFFLSDFGYSLEKKKDFCSTQRDSYAKEFGVTNDSKKVIDAKFRKVRADVENLFESNAEISVYLAALLKEKSKKMVTICDELLDKQEKFPDLDVANILASYIHMMINRIFRSRQRFHEFIVYDFLFREYRSRIARMKDATVHNN